jgi:hypothetical protein
MEDNVRGNSNKTPPNGYFLFRDLKAFGCCHQEESNWGLQDVGEVRSDNRSATGDLLARA